MGASPHQGHVLPLLKHSALPMYGHNGTHIDVWPYSTVTPVPIMFKCGTGGKTVCTLFLSFLHLQNNIPVFCPALTDGSMGDMIYIHSYKNPGLIIDIAQGELL